MPRVLPKPPLILPAILLGRANGQLPPSVLEPTTFGNALAVAPAARAFRAFAAVEARPRRLDPRHVGGYRDLRGQWTIFGGSQARYEPCSVVEYLTTPSQHRKTFRAANRAACRAIGIDVPDAFYWRKIRRADGSWPATAAEPGTSNHGLGLAVDVAEERDGDPEPEAISAELLELLIARGHLYGLGAELDSEVWHWRYFAGDAIPAAVLAYESTFATFEPDYPKPTFRLGSTGANVTEFQHHNNLWCPLKLAVDGNAGPQTIGQVQAFQAALGLTTDGVYGPITAAKYRAVLIDLHNASKAGT